jgi:hypothetical protein
MIPLTWAQEVWSSNLHAPTNPFNKSTDPISGIGIRRSRETVKHLRSFPHPTVGCTVWESQGGPHAVARRGR